MKQIDQLQIAILEPKVISSLVFTNLCVCYITIFVKLNLNINFLINQRIFLCLTLQKHLWSLDIILAIFFTYDLYYSLCLVITLVRGSHWSRTHASNHFFFIIIRFSSKHTNLLKKYYNHRKHIELLFHVIFNYFITNNCSW